MLVLSHHVKTYTVLGVNSTRLFDTEHVNDDYQSDVDYLRKSCTSLYVK